MPAIKFDINAPLPGQGIAEKLIKAGIKDRETMSQPNRDEFDRVRLAMLRGWHNFWISIGWPGEKV